MMHSRATRGALIENRNRLMADLVYEVSFEGVASPMLQAAFPGCDLDTGAGLTVVRCSQDELRGVIVRIEELALQLLDIRLVAEHSPEP